MYPHFVKVCLYLFFGKLSYSEQYMSQTLLIKLGGSIITDKNNANYNVQTEIVSHCLRTLKQFLTEHPRTNLVLIHGAGGHIHHLAKTYELTTSSAGNAEKLAHAYAVQKTTKRLSDAIATLAHRLDFPAVQIPTCEVVTNDGGAFKKITMDRIAEALASGSVPLLYGDMVPDKHYGLSICSGDTLIAELAPLLGATRVVYVSDIDGIHTSDPYKNDDAELIQTITVSKLHHDHITVTGSHSIDVTGGLKNKLEPVVKLFAATPTLTSIEICNGLKPHVLQAVLSQKPVPHTTITK